MSMRRKTCLLYVVSKIKKTLYLCVFMINLFALGSVDAMAGWTTIDVPGAYGAKPTKAYGIDGSNIVGTYGDASGGQHGFLYNGSSWTTLDMPGADATGASGIDGGNIVGDYTDGSGWTYSFLYNGSSWTTLDVPGSYFASDIDGSNIVGGNGAIGFLYNGTTLTTLVVPSASGTGVSSIDGSNIVGWYYGASSHHGFLYNGSSWTTLDMPGASETFAHGIDGSNIVGQYFDASGGYHGFVYVIPEPATLLLLALGGLALIRRRR